LRREFPDLRGRGLVGGAEFFDAQMDDARLCIEVLRTAACHGATAANHVEAIAFEKEAGRIIGVQARDHIGGGVVTIRARQVLNVTGPWSDAVRRLAGENTGPMLRPTKGVHLIAPDRGLRAAFLLLHPADGRVFFVIPWLGKTLIGTTDTECPEGPDHLTVTREDIRYLLEGHNHYFDSGLKESDLLNDFVGLRPLLRGNADNPSALTREFHLAESATGLWTVAGGKYTTFRQMAEVITDAVTARLVLHRRCRTRTFLLDGTPRGPWSVYRRYEVARLVSSLGMSPAVAQHLVSRYGRRAEEVACFGSWQPIHPEEPDLRGELHYQRQEEMAVFPADFLLRRTRLGLFHPKVQLPPA